MRAQGLGYKMIAWIYRWLNYDKAAELSVESDEQCLLHAAKVGDADTLQSLISKGCSVNAYNPQGSTPLHLAVKGNHRECIKVLLEQPDTDLQSLDRWGRSPLHSAVIWQRLDLLKLLIEHKPESTNVSDADGKTILHIASATGATEFVKYLMTTKINKNSVDHRRWTPLMCAVAIQSIDTVRHLLEGGAGCNEPLRHNACMSALRLAIEKHNLPIVKLLLDYGAMVEFTVTVNLGSFKRSGGRRYSHVCHNLATVAVENVDLTHMQSIEIAYRVIQSSPAAPDEDACLKVGSV
ncbi:hypothetical protein EB796_001042 [Bugula neritina]|uniref:Uncharacterized protein n=1 Tax=Bugula neritina TaxID=10212 RepID=A0A7J7KR58_BUGNE|nr:hypothetical protein EB796_001042 [Bugula neritina]